MAEVPALDLPHVSSGKVRDIYQLDADNLVFIASDRMSAFDVVMAEPIPNKGRVLTAMTAYWMQELIDVVPNHEASPNPYELPEVLDHEYYRGRTGIVRRADMIDIECIVRGRITGSAWEEYVRTGGFQDFDLPAGMQESEAFPDPIFTPSTKAKEGRHDVNITFDDAVEIVGGEVAEQARDISLKAYLRLYKRGLEKGIIVADTKFELGFIDGALSLCDEVGTPDSSRFWPADKVVVGQTPPSFDKQPLRDYLKNLGWDKQPPPPALPPEIVASTSQRYAEGYERLTGLSLADWPGIHVAIGNLAIDLQE